jgi:hypothetical protein
MKRPITLISMSEQKYYNVRALAIMASMASMLFLLVILWMANEINRLYNYIEALYPL